jgi:hypothetical protein
LRMAQGDSYDYFHEGSSRNINNLSMLSSSD